MEPPRFAHEQVTGRSSFPDVFVVSKPVPGTAAAKALERFYEDHPDMKSYVPRYFQDEIINGVDDVLRNGYRGFHARYHDMDSKARYILPKPWQCESFNALNLWKHKDALQMNNGSTFHVDSPTDPNGSSIILLFRGAKRVFIYTPEDFGNAARYARENHLFFPASKSLIDTFPGITPVDMGCSRTHMCKWYTRSYETMCGDGFGPTWEFVMQPGELLVFRNGTVHGTLCSPDDEYGALVNLLECRVVFDK